MLLGRLEGDVHVAVTARQDACPEAISARGVAKRTAVVDTRRETNGDALAHDAFEEVGRRAGGGGGGGGGRRAAGCNVGRGEAGETGGRAVEGQDAG